MSNIEPDDIDEKPLDPQMEKVRRKMVRLLTVSIGIMFVGVMAVLFAIVYKFTRSDDANAPAPIADNGVPVDAPLVDSVSLPAGFRVVSVSMSGTRLTIFGKGSDGGSRILLFDATTGQRLGTIETSQAR